MNTLFEVLVIGENSENLAAAAEMALDEVERVEQLLSRFDPRSETSRLNCQAGKAPVLVDYEMWEVLQTCRRWWQRTDGCFDITIQSTPSARCGFDSVVLDESSRTVFFEQPEIQLDFGAFGKGYALDCAAVLLREYGIQNAFLHGGTSSVLALGCDKVGAPWRVGLRNPWKDSSEIGAVTLWNQALSTSAVFQQSGQPSSDVINPLTKTALSQQAACSVVAATGAEAEILSTALLCMGQANAAAFCARLQAGGLTVAWIEMKEMDPQLNWLCRTNF